MKFTWLLAAVVIAGWLIIRRHKQHRWVQVGEVIVIVGALLVGFGIVPLPNFEQLLEDAGQALGKWTYLAVGLMAFLETGAFLGFVAPGETAVIVGGLVAGQGEISLLALIAIVWVCCVLGDLTAYEIGRRLGRQWLLKHGERLQITEDRLETVEGFLEKRGAVFIVFGRFLGLVRPLIPFTAGASRMPLRRFLPYDVLAAGLWSITFCTLGFLFWRSIDQLTTYVSRGLFAFGTLVVVIGGIVTLIHLRRSPEARAKVRDWIDAHDEEPGWKHVAKIARPVWHLLLNPAAKVADMAARFTADRVTPGNLGLELTTLLALGLIGAFSFFLIGDAILNNPNPRHRSHGGRPRRPAAQRDARRRRPRRHGHRLLAGHGDPDARHRDLRRRQTALARRRRADRRLAAGLRRGPRHQDRLRPRAPGRSVHRHLQRRLPLRPHRLRDLADRDRHRARARGGRLGGADRARDGGRRSSP